MKTKFDVYDYLIFVFILVLSIGIGLFFGFNLNEKLKTLLQRLFKKSSQVVEPSKNEIDLVEQQYGEKEVDGENEGEKGEEEENVKTMEYLTANHSMSAFPIALSLLATFFSSSSLLGFPAEVYLYGIQYWIIVFGVCLVPLIGGNNYILLLRINFLHLTLYLILVILNIYYSFCDWAFFSKSRYRLGV